MFELDLYELAEALNEPGMAIDKTTVRELIERLQAAESELDKRTDQLLEMREDRNKMFFQLQQLQSKLDEMEKQDPIGFIDSEGDTHIDKERLSGGCYFYANPLPVQQQEWQSIETAPHRVESHGERYEKLLGIAKAVADGNFNQAEVIKLAREIMS